MKVALINDQHFGGKQDSQNFSNYIEVFYREQFFPYLSENNICTVIDLGDTFDRRKFVNFNTLDKVRQFYFDIYLDDSLDKLNDYPWYRKLIPTREETLIKMFDIEKD